MCFVYINHLLWDFFDIRDMIVKNPTIISPTIWHAFNANIMKRIATKCVCERDEPLTFDDCLKFKPSLDILLSSRDNKNPSYYRPFHLHLFEHTRENVEPTDHLQHI